MLDSMSGWRRQYSPTRPYGISVSSGRTGRFKLHYESLENREVEISVGEFYQEMLPVYVSL